MKKIIIVKFVIFLIFSIVACDNTINDLNDTPEDNEPPVYLQTPGSRFIFSTAIEFLVRINEDSYIYYIVLPRDAEIDINYLNVIEVNYNQVLVSGKELMLKNKLTVFMIENLSPETEYDIYFVIKDLRSNVNKTVFKYQSETSG